MPTPFFGLIPAYPKRAQMWHEDSLVLVGNPLVKEVTSSQQHGIYSYQSTAAINDKFTHGFLLDAGTYTFEVLGIVQVDSGQVDWSLDGVTIVTDQDWYAGVSFNERKTVSGVVVATSGWHVLQGLVDSKHASSSNYLLRLTKLAFIPAAD
ncbi:MAG TPA: hypothetical protein VJ733_09980 [Candidatus Binatia bacterium]|nr:hypothetical protein [Candidatus Binatia bacterium]